MLTQTQLLEEVGALQPPSLPMREKSSTPPPSYTTSDRDRNPHRERDLAAPESERERERERDRPRRLRKPSRSQYYENVDVMSSVSLPASPPSQAPLPPLPTSSLSTTSVATTAVAAPPTSSRHSRPTSKPVGSTKPDRSHPPVIKPPKSHTKSKPQGGRSSSVGSDRSTASHSYHYRRSRAISATNTTDAGRIQEAIACLGSMLAAYEAGMVTDAQYIAEQALLAKEILEGGEGRSTLVFPRAGAGENLTDSSGSTSC